MDKDNEEDYDNASTIEEVLNAQQSNETNITECCTYARGYLKRQPLFACLTCNPASGDTDSQAAGICLACSLHCHNGHELVELCTKRNFRCDCGNSKFTNLTCTLNKEKCAKNELNSYNQNFEGKFCTCHRPYLDTDNIVEDDMLQCIICEDWIHFCHLDVPIPHASYDGEMICKNCMEKHEFLYNYAKLTIDDQNNENNHKDVSKVNSETCTMPNTPNVVKRGTKYWQENWRKSLCKCPKCMAIYETENLLYLLDEEDTIDFYENSGQFKNLPLDLEQTMDSDALELAMSILKTADRVPVLNVISAYEEMKKNLFEYLKKFADNKKVVREENIIEFFQGWTTRKKRRHN